MEGSDEVREIFCEPCGKEQQKTIAEGICVDCSEYLCGQCYNHHKRFKQFEHHVLQDKSSIPLGPMHMMSENVCIFKCQVHLDKDIEYICKSCDMIGCNVCMTINHRQCGNVIYIPDEMKNAETSGELQEFAKLIDDMHDEQQELYDKICQNFQVSNEMNETAGIDLERQKDQIVTFFEGMYEKVNTEVVEKQDADNKVFETLLNEVRVMQTDLKNRKAQLKSLEHGQHIREAFIYIKSTKTAMKKMSSDMVELSEKGIKRPARYEPSLDVDELKEDFKELGRLVTVESDQKTQIHVESVKKKIEKELQMIRRENEDLKDELGTTKAKVEGLKKKMMELQSILQEEEKNNKHLKTEKENQKLDYESRLRKSQDELRTKEELRKKTQEELRKSQDELRTKEGLRRKTQEELNKVKDELSTKEMQHRNDQKEILKIGAELRAKEIENECEKMLLQRKVAKYEAENIQRSVQEKTREAEEELKRRRKREKIQKEKEEEERRERIEREQEEERRRRPKSVILEMMRLGMEEKRRKEEEENNSSRGLFKALWKQL